MNEDTKAIVASNLTIALCNNATEIEKDIVFDADFVTKTYLEFLTKLDNIEELAVQNKKDSTEPFDEQEYFKKKYGHLNKNIDNQTIAISSEKAGTDDYKNKRK